jgi:uncharacterized membrane protein YgcG
VTGVSEILVGRGNGKYRIISHPRSPDRRIPRSSIIQGFCFMATPNSSPALFRKAASTVTFAVIRELIKETTCIIVTVRLWDFSVTVFLVNTGRLPGVVTCCGQSQGFCKYLARGQGGKGKGGKGKGGKGGKFCKIFSLCYISVN